MQANQPLRFSRIDSKQFFKTFNQRVNNYFKENNVAKTGNWKLYVKTVRYVFAHGRALCFGTHPGH